MGVSHLEINQALPAIGHQPGLGKRSGGRAPHPAPRRAAEPAPKGRNPLSQDKGTEKQEESQSAHACGCQCRDPQRGGRTGGGATGKGRV